MIEYIKGRIAELTPTTVVLETAGGVAYLLNISLPVYSELEGKSDARLLVHESIREDAWVMYGFTTQRERELFRALIGVSGVGTSTASLILSAISVPDLEVIISSGDDSRLKKVKGIGAKTAQRIIVDLRDKIKIVSAGADVTLDVPTSEAAEEALAALVMLGYTKQQSQKALKRIFDDNPATRVETAIKKALAML